jgi:hypothetical protein
VRTPSWVHPGDRRSPRSTRVAALLKIRGPDCSGFSYSTSYNHNKSEREVRLKRLRRWKTT